MKKKLYGFKVSVPGSVYDYSVVVVVAPTREKAVERLGASAEYIQDEYEPEPLDGIIDIDCSH